MTPRSRATAWRILLLSALTAAWVPTTFAQAWLPKSGDLSISLSYDYILNKHHYLPNGDELDVGHTRSNIEGLSVGWSPSDRWRLVAGIPYVQTQWLGEGHHGPEVDTGHVNRTLTDLRLEVHYQALEYPVALAPYAAAVIPVHDYPVLGHAAPGRGLNEYWIGFFAGKSLEPWLAQTYVQARYNYAFVERVVGIAHDRSNVDVEVGQFLSPTWLLQLIGSWQWTHGGINVPVPPGSAIFPHHDQLAAAEFLNLTGSVIWFASARSYLSLGYTRALHGSNAHKVDRGVTFSIGFRPFAR
jgi:hypothetical protein